MAQRADQRSDPPSGLRVGLVGAGGIADVHAAAWRNLGAELLVHSVGGAEDLVAAYGGRVVPTLAELLAACDLVDVCTPTPVHGPVVRAAASAGRPVICEKPLALTAAEAGELLEACDRAGVALYPAHVVRWFPAYAALQEAVAGGLIGAVVVQRFTRIGSRPDQPWFADDARSGGNVTDQCIHDLDLARWTAGEVVSVFAQQTERLPVRSVQVQLRHVGGAISYVTGIWARPGTRFRTSFEVAGTRGRLHHDSLEHRELGLDLGSTTDGPGSAEVSQGLLPALGFGESPYQTQLRELSEAIATGVVPRVSATDGVRAVALAEAARESLNSGAAVSVSDPFTCGERR